MAGRCRLRDSSRAARRQPRTSLRPARQRDRNQLVDGGTCGWHRSGDRRSARTLSAHSVSAPGSPHPTMRPYPDCARCGGFPFSLGLGAKVRSQRPGPVVPEPDTPDSLAVLGHVAGLLSTALSTGLRAPRQIPGRRMNTEADARTRTGDPFITSTQMGSRLRSVRLGFWLWWRLPPHGRRCRFRHVSAAYVALARPTRASVG